MWKCHKCGKPVYFAERKQSLGRDWHPECLRCEECGKRLHPGQHVEHKGVPYCHVPCYGALFGPQLFGHGTKVESHKSFGQQKDAPKVNGSVLPRSHLESKLKVYNQFYDGKSGEIRSREVNGRLILEGPLRIHWGVQGVIHLKENDDQRTVVTVRKRNSYRVSSDFDSDEDSHDIMTDSSYNDISTSSDLTASTNTLSPDDRTDTGIDSGTDTSTSETLDSCSPTEIMPRSLTLPNKLDIKCVEWDELDELLQVERKIDETDKLYQTMPVALPSQTSIDSTTSTYSNSSSSTEKNENVTQTSNTEVETSNTITQFRDSDDEIYYTMPTALPTLMSRDGDMASAFKESAEKIDNSYKSNGGSTDVSSSYATQSYSKDDTWTDSGNQLNRSMSGPDCLERMRGNREHSPEFDRSAATSCDVSSSQDDVVLRKKAVRTGACAIKRRTGKRLSRSKIKRRCSINGHFYDRETSFFTPPHGSQMSVWVTSLVNTQEVINLILEKYKVDSDGNNFALFVIRDNGEQKRLKDDDYPLLCRVLLGPHEDVVRLFLMDGQSTSEVSNEVAQFLNFTLAECRGILNQYHSQEEKEIIRVRDKYSEMKRRVKQRMDDLKVRL